ncbi:ParB/RepB/Spo0J family partition protein [Streptomyces sp. NPDC059382]|uniref:ParB/RepB/Spo0J family partition protein n=1 Tax=Streptomyces sp. NPDC059382 TaxID=3346816 RepID=UPI0036A03ECA
MTVTQNEETQAAAEEVEVGRLELIDPLKDFDPEDKQSRVIVDPFNHRKERDQGQDTTEPDPGLIASVDAVGVQQAPVLRPQEGPDEGRLGIVMGQRRMKAARVAALQAVAEGRPYRKVRVIIRDDLKGVDDEALIGSMAENVHRVAASAQDDLDAAQQIALIVQAKRVPKERRARLSAAIGRTEEELDAAHKVAKIAPEVIEELHEDDVDFDWVELADYDEVKDIRTALWTLERAKRTDEQENNAMRGAWKQAMGSLRAEVAKKERIATLTKELADKGVTLLPWQRSWANVSTPTRPLDELVSAIGRPLSPDAHEETCKGHAAAIDPDDAEVLWLCTNWKKYKHAPAEGQAEGGAGSAAGDAAAAEAKLEEERAAKRRVKKNNAAWLAARPVRMDHITTMCAGKGEPSAEVKRLVLEMILAGQGGGFRGARLGLLLNATVNSHGGVAALVAKTGTKRMWWLLFGQIAAVMEEEYMRDGAWRGVYQPESGRWNAIHHRTAQWLELLKASDYSLSEVEEETRATAEREEKELAERNARWEREARERGEARAKERAGKGGAADDQEGEDDDGDANEEDYQYDDQDEEPAEPDADMDQQEEQEQEHEPAEDPNEADEE